MIQVKQADPAIQFSGCSISRLIVAFVVSTKINHLSWRRDLRGAIPSRDELADFVGYHAFSCQPIESIRDPPSRPDACLGNKAKCPQSRSQELWEWPKILISLRSQAYENFHFLSSSLPPSPSPSLSLSLPLTHWLAGFRHLSQTLGRPRNPLAAISNPLFETLFTWIPGAILWRN